MLSLSYMVYRNGYRNEILFAENFNIGRDVVSTSKWRFLFE